MSSVQQVAPPIAEAAPGSQGRFGFGDNWRKYLAGVDDSRIDAATRALQALLGGRLDGCRVLDIGSGSGIHSLAALRLGAEVVSFDFDGDSVACSEFLRAQYAGAAADQWRIVGQGSVLDPAFMSSLGAFDVVYSWGVLHHTGALQRAVIAAAERVRPGGRLVLALYNDQGWISSYWGVVKRTYNHSQLGRILITGVHMPYLGARVAVRLLRNAGALERGMAMWHDYLDWLGGWPFEVASPAQVSAWVRPAGFSPQLVRDVGRRHGCNEFVFVQSNDH
jgi:2-polyprenyl-3-methyl-5-hydroxy-6-metoxy-1,4-benzoquinol methylase